MSARRGKPAAPAPDAKATPREVADYLRKSEGTLANWRTKGKGPRWTKLGGSILYTWADVYAWEKSQPCGGAGIRRSKSRRESSAPTVGAALPQRPPSSSPAVSPGRRTQEQPGAGPG